MGTHRKQLTKWESIFAGDRFWDVDDEGLEQFREFESKGRFPTVPAEGFWILHRGKQGFFLAKSEAKKGWEQGTDAWFGLDHYERTMRPETLKAFLGFHPKYAPQKETREPSE